MLEIHFRPIVGRPPRGKQKRYLELVLSAIDTKGRDRPKGREKIEWKLLPDLRVHSCLDAIKKLEWYAQRRKIEKILNSGCRVEDAKLRTAEQLANLVAIPWSLRWRILCISS